MSENTEGQLSPPIGQNDHVTGNARASVTLVEYGDYECPSCGAAYPVVKKIQQLLGDKLRFAFRNFPLSEAHKHAEHAAESAEAVGALAGESAFWEMHDTLFENQDALDDENLILYAEQAGEVDTEAMTKALEDGEYRARVREDFRSGLRSGVNGTPTFFINGIRYDDRWDDVDAFVQALQSA